MNLDDVYPWDKEFKERYVICGVCALDRCGLTSGSGATLDLFTKYKELDGLDCVAFRWVYNPSVNYEDFLKPMETNPNLLLPSRERAIVESILFSHRVDEGVMLEAIWRYGWQVDSLARLYEVAERFGLPRGDLDYWIKEAEEFMGSEV